MGVGEGITVGAGGAGGAVGDLLLVITGGRVKTVANEFEDRREAARAKPRGKLEEDKAEIMP